MIKFMDPPIAVGLTTYAELVELLPSCSSAVGFCISVGSKFFREGMSDIDNTILPLLKSNSNVSVSPRVLSSYSILVWFTEQVGSHNKIILFCFSS